MKKACFAVLAAGALACAAQAPAPQRVPERGFAARLVLGWRLGVHTYAFRQFTFFEAVDRTAGLGLRFVEGYSRQKISADIPKNLDLNLTEAEAAAVRDKLRSSGVSMPVYYNRDIPKDEAGCRRFFAFAKSLGVETIVSEPVPQELEFLDRFATEYGINIAIHNHAQEASPIYWDPKNVLKAVEGRSKRIGACADIGNWMRAGIRPIDGLRLLKDRLISIHLKDASELGGQARDVIPGTGVIPLPEFFAELERLELKPTLLSLEYPNNPEDPSPDLARAVAFLEKSIEPLVTGRVEQVSRVTPIRKELPLDERQKIEAALPRKAPARPVKPRKLLVVDLNIAYGGHPSIAHANVAVELMGKKTGAYEPVFSNDLANLRGGKLRQFDALYLNNTVGPSLNGREIRENLIRFIQEGGGLIGNHGTGRTSLDWPEFAEMLGGYAGPHNISDEKITIQVDDPSSPLNAAFGGKSFAWTGEYFRFPSPPYSRQKLHVLLSWDVTKTDMHQGQSFPGLTRDDNDYAISWIREYGKGRVFYMAFGHGTGDFQSPRILEHFLAGIQFALGDLKADATPSAKPQPGK